MSHRLRRAALWWGSNAPRASHFRILLDQEKHCINCTQCLFPAANGEELVFQSDSVIQRTRRVNHSVQRQHTVLSPRFSCYPSRFPLQFTSKEKVRLETTSPAHFIPHTKPQTQQKGWGHRLRAQSSSLPCVAPTAAGLVLGVLELSPGPCDTERSGVIAEGKKKTILCAALTNILHLELKGISERGRRLLVSYRRTLSGGWIPPVTSHRAEQTPHLPSLPLTTSQQGSLINPHRQEAHCVGKPP